MQQSIQTRLRERRRRKSLRLLRLIVILALLIAAAVSGWRYIHRPGFAFGSITVSGTDQLTEADVIKMAGSQPPVNLFSISSGKVLEGLKHDIRFQNADVSYELPATMAIMVEERVPALYVENSYRSYLKLDYSGLVMTVTNSIPDANAPMLVGENCGNVFIGDTVTNQNVLNILQFLLKIDEEARSRIVGITVDGNKNLKLQMHGSFPILLGRVEEIAHKPELFMTVFKEIKDKNINAEYIDLTFAKPYIKLIPGKNEADKIK